MLMEMTERVPDSSAVAVYREDDAARSGKDVACDPKAGFDWGALTVEATAMAQVALANTNWIPGRG